MNGKILVNSRFRLRPVTGVERWAAAVVDALNKDRLVEVRPSSSRQGWRGHLWEQVALPARLAPGDLLFSPANSGPVSVGRQVLCLFDLGPLDHPEWYRADFAAWYRLMVPMLARRVAHIITTSAFSKRRIMLRLGIRDDRISVIRGGVDRRFFHPRSPSEIHTVRRKYGLPDCFLLFVGSVQRRKNISALLEAQKHLRGSVPVVVVGGRGPQFSSLALSPAIFLGRIQDSDLPAVFSAAAMLVNPSLYEGGGLTVLEAMACGCPVVAAGNSALPEYTGSAALLVTPVRPAGLAQAVQALLDDGGQRDALVEAGLAQSARFGWKKCAEEVWALLEDSAG